MLVTCIDKNQGCTILPKSYLGITISTGMMNFYSHMYMCMCSQTYNITAAETAKQK